MARDTNKRGRYPTIPHQPSLLPPSILLLVIWVQTQATASTTTQLLSGTQSPARQRRRSSHRNRCVFQVAFDVRQITSQAAPTPRPSTRPLSPQQRRRHPSLTITLPRFRPVTGDIAPTHSVRVADTHHPGPTLQLPRALPVATQASIDPTSTVSRRTLKISHRLQVMLPSTRTWNFTSQRTKSPIRNPSSPSGGRAVWRIMISYSQHKPYCFLATLCMLLPPLLQHSIPPTPSSPSPICFARKICHQLRSTIG
jgi:hypothetical protein